MQVGDIFLLICQIIDSCSICFLKIGSAVHRLVSLVYGGFVLLIPYANFLRNSLHFYLCGFYCFSFHRSVIKFPLYFVYIDHGSALFLFSKYIFMCNFSQFLTVFQNKICKIAARAIIENIVNSEC